MLVLVVLVLVLVLLVVVVRVCAYVCMCVCVDLLSGELRAPLWPRSHPAEVCLPLAARCTPADDAQRVAFLWHIQVCGHPRA